MGSTRIPVYLSAEMDRELEDLEVSKSEFIREATRKELDRRRNGDEH